MADPFKVLRVLDEKITDILTTFCWWTDTAFNQDNVWWAKFTVLCFFPTTHITQNFLYERPANFAEASGMVLGAYTGSFLMYWLVSKFSKKHLPTLWVVISNARKNPNKNRASHYFLFIKVLSPIVTVIMWATGLQKFFFNENYFDFSAIFSLELVLYFLCTEPIPPANLVAQSI